MRSSARSTDGFSLVEVVIATAVFSFVMIMALSQFKEGTDATKLALAQADLRRNGEALLERIASDLRSTQARYVGAGQSTVQLYRIASVEPRFDTTAGGPLLQGGATPVVFEYAQSSPATSRNLTLRMAPVAGLATAQALPLSTELALAGEKPFPTSAALAGGFNVSVTSGTLPGLLSASAAFADQPVALVLQLVLKRTLGKRFAGELGTQGSWDIYVTLETRVELRPSGAY